MALLLEGTNQPLCDLVKRHRWTAVTFQRPGVCTTYYRREFAFPASRVSVGPAPQAENPTQQSLAREKPLQREVWKRTPDPGRHWFSHAPDLPGAASLLECWNGFICLFSVQAVATFSSKRGDLLPEE